MEKLTFVMTLNVSDFTFSGEFGSVFKAHLKWHRTAETEIVAVKTMKGTPVYSCGPL